MSKRTFDNFDAFASNYRTIHSQNVKLSGADSYYFAEMKVKYLQQFENDEPLQVLDIGCGDGTTGFFMQQYFPQWKLCGIDVSEESIKVAQKKNIAQAVFYEYNGTQIQAQNESFDIVFIAGVLHHVNYSLHQLLIKEMARVLKKSGRLYLFEHNPFNPVTKYLVNTCVFDKDARLLKSSYSTQLLKLSGFHISKKQFIIFFPRKGILSKLIFLEKFLQWLPLGGQYAIKAVKL